MIIKNIIRSVLNFLHFDLTKNLEYDRLTKAIMKKHINHNSNCIDVGCHKGEILDIMIKYSKSGKLFAFEPIPDLYNLLKNGFGERVAIYPFAVSDKSGSTKFQYVKNAPAYSGINKRSYAIENPDIQEINVEKTTLDEIIPADVKIDFIKIDVEGGEFGVLKGAKKILLKYKPIVIFESGLGASDYYGTQPEELYSYVVTQLGLEISTLKGFINKEKSLAIADFVNNYRNKKEYYFIAHNINSKA
jgi:FkbM family methyltransferase